VLALPPSLRIKHQHEENTRCNNYELGMIMRYKAAIFLTLVCLNAQANVIQYFTGITYSNPAELFTIKKQ